MPDVAAETIFVRLALLVIALIGMVALAWIHLIRPRMALYVLFALLPTQFIFIPVSDFFISPADVLVLSAAGALTFRLLEGRSHTWAALRLHVFLGLMVVSYAIGFLVLSHFSRTIIRVPMAIVPSILACELLRERRHLSHATAALTIGGILDAAYGTYFYASGVPLHPTRFSGMMGGNFSATIILTSAVVAFARFARTRQPVKLLWPGLLAVFGIATLSRMGVIALIVAWMAVISRVATRSTKRLVAVSVAAIAVVALSQDAIRERVLARGQPEIQIDGVVRSSSGVRAGILRSVWRGFLERPFVGVGYFGFQKYSAADPEISAPTMGTGYQTHNTYLEVLVEGGLLAFIPFMLHFAQYRHGFRRAWRLVTREHDVIVAASIVGLPFMAVVAALANVLLHYQFWAVVGLGLACLRVVGAEAASLHRPTPTVA